ncbi:MAG: NADH-quinone oxidoreductase subunit A [Fimbriimonadaceae bacterium]|nr:NADH-quinone oxidoreductase subunit A [Fimbriimonadaceae bacterium]
MQESYLGILVMVSVAVVVCGAMVTLSWLLGPKTVTAYKSSPYECGVEPVGTARERFPIKFYLIAILFILFDIEAVFLWGWYTAFKNSETDFMVFSFIEFLVYMGTWILGYVYAIRVGAIDWDETTSLAPEKLREREALEIASLTPATAPAMATASAMATSGDAA